MFRLAKLLSILLVASLLTTSCKNKGKSGPQLPSFELPSFASTKEISWKFEYDSKDRLTKSVDPGGKVTELAYAFFDADEQTLQRLIQRNADDSVSYGFDRFGRLETMDDAAGSLNYEYDGFSNVTSVKRMGGSGIDYTWNALNQLSTYRLNDAFTIEYEYDFLGRPKTMKTPVGVISYEYWAGQSTVKRTFPNGISTYWKFLPDGKLESISHINKANSVLNKYVYGYTPDGLINEINEWSPQGERVLKYGYDTVKRLVSFENSQGEKTLYSYDLLGNRTSVTTNGDIKETVVYDGAGKMVSQNGAKCAYDASGNLVSYTDDFDKPTYTFNASNKLKTANGVTYEYDGNGNIITRKSKGKHSTYFPDPFAGLWKPLAETTGDKTSYYIWEGEHPIAVVENGKAHFYLEDHLGSVRGIANHQGTITGQFSFSPFGIPNTVPITDFAPSFSGLFYDKQANVVQTLTRAYNPNTGRFLQMDPMHHIPSGTQKDLSMYAYCGGDPVNFMDRNGTQSQSASEEELKRIETAARQLVINQWDKNYPNETNPGYLKCFQWQNLVYDDLQKLNLKHWNIIRYAEYDPYNPDFITHAFIVIQDATNPTIKFIIDPWVQDFSARYKDYTPNKGLQDGSAGNLQSFVPKPNYIRNSQKFEDTDDTTAADVWGLLKSWAVPKLMRQKEKMGNSIRNLKFKLNSFREKHKPKINELIDIINIFKVKEAYGDEIPTSGMASNVGGVYLGGAGQSLEGLTQISGVAVDYDTGRLLLLGNAKTEVALPPLRLDDVVTVFRSVYNGEAPYVSIDPNPEDPKGDLMLTRHSEATKNTYVGWILFETDRVMKSYSLTKDNETRQLVNSSVPGYSEILNSRFSDDSSNGKIWSRFWIVPGEVKQSLSKENEVSLYDMALKVNTQQMKLQNGNLVAAENDAPSPSAKKFATWFTQNYDAIANEALYAPPTESGIHGKVAIFKELKRFALITALAENLRDKGVTFPFWMRDYKVKSFATPKTTPAITVVNSNNQVTHTIYGGVDLSTSKNRITVSKDNAHANKVANNVSDLRTKPFLEPVVLFNDSNGQGAAKMVALAMPGTETKALAPCQIVETDLMVTLKHGGALSFDRHYNSFFNPDGIFGEVWTLNLPKLEAQKIPKGRTDDKVQFVIQNNIISPLNSVNLTEVDLYEGENTNIGYKTRMYISPDNSRLHFDDNGNLVGIETQGYITIYRRDKTQRLQKIEGWYHNTMEASIELVYSIAGTLSSVTGSNGKRIDYTYDKEGTLLGVASPNGTIKYDYQNNKLSQIYQDDVLLKQFDYNAKGQLLKETDAGKNKVTYQITTTTKGHKLGITSADGSLNLAYDASYRPLTLETADNSRVQWNYNSDNSITAQFDSSTGETYKMAVSANGKERSIELPLGGTFQSEHDSDGRLLNLRKNDENIMQQHWNADGTLQSMHYGKTVLQPEYNKYGEPIRTIIGNRTTDNTFKEWSENVLDDDGRLAHIKDYTGKDIRFQYDEHGDVSAISNNENTIAIERNNNGNIDEIKTSWGAYQRLSYTEGNLDKIEVGTGKYKNEINFMDGLPSQISQYDGGKWDFSYTNNPEDKLLQEIRAPNDLLFNYKYDTENKLKSVAVGGEYSIEYGRDNNGRLSEIKFKYR